ncbi:S1/P1 nuclease [Veronia pacifica]|uniref:Endonuclease n=1 Tax=Veronia pacifica TaxID=1080227 RepID=A0A1C3ED01_9GAMM|nr:S1/P1 nuclease [Veronia pacifica]ODA31109.1 endonuclease [Veronia pacifica]
MKSLAFIPLAFTALLVTAYTPSAIAWNYQGHVTIAQIAYQNLDKDVQKKVDALATKAYNSMPDHILEKMESVQGASKFARLAMVPDLIRNMPAKDVWLLMGERIPESVNGWDDKTTGGWHYINQAYPAKSDCEFVKEPNIVMVNDALYASFKRHPKAATMMFLSHLAGDAHQPMHSVTQSTSELLCISDFGANKYSLDVAQKDLHHFWDSGLGFLEQPFNVDKMAKELQVAFPKASFSQGQGNVSSWVDESYQLAYFAYNTPKGQKPGKTYYKKGTEMVRQRLTQAGYRLAGEMNEALATINR